MGLCFERLRLVSRAGESYKYIIDRAKKVETDDGKLSETLTNLLQMAQWRGEQLSWSYTTETTLQRLLGDPQTMPAAPIENVKSVSARQ